MNKTKLTYMISTGLYLMTLGGAIRHLLYGDLIYRKCILKTWISNISYLSTRGFKILGIIMVWLGKPKLLSNLAYSGLFWNFLLAVTAHIAVNDGEFAGALMCLILLVTSFF